MKPVESWVRSLSEVNKEAGGVLCPAQWDQQPVVACYIWEGAWSEGTRKVKHSWPQEKRLGWEPGTPVLCAFLWTHHFTSPLP